MIDELRRMCEMVKDAPPPIRVMYARHDVPVGPPFHMWNTRGEMVVYINRSMIEGLPKQPTSIREMMDMTALTGIPVVVEGPESHMHVRWDGSVYVSSSS